MKDSSLKELLEITNTLPENEKLEKVFDWKDKRDLSKVYINVEEHTDKYGNTVVVEENFNTDSFIYTKALNLFKDYGILLLNLIIFTKINIFIKIVLILILTIYTGTIFFF